MQLVPQNGKFGFDVIAYVGEELFTKSRSELEIQHHLSEKNIPISIREIGYLGVKYIVYLAILHKEARGPIKTILQSQGGYILHLDGTCEGDSPHLMTTLDEISDLILGNVKLPSENAVMISQFLRKIKQDYGTPLALVHDMGTGILDAVAEVFPGVSDFICHFHFLRDIGKDLFGLEHTMLGDGFKKHRTRTHLRATAKKFLALINRDQKLRRQLDSITIATFMDDQQKDRLPGLIVGYLLILWLLDYSHDLNGIGFPFDRAQLAFYYRVLIAWGLVQKYPGSQAATHPIAELRSRLATVVKDRDMQRMADRVREKAGVFDQLRAAMRIAEGTDGLNDDGDDCDMLTIKQNVTEFREKLKARIAMQKSPDRSYKKMLKQMDKYWIKLFADPIPVVTANDIIFIQPQRTNNILERLFRDTKRGYRKKNGARSLSKTLRTMLADTPLVRNLKNDKYMTAILNGAPDLPTRFAQIEIDVIRKEIRAATATTEKIPAPIKKIVRMPGLPTKIIQKQEIHAHL